MKRAAFALLCGVSKPMISKYAAFIVESGPGEVDAAATLAALEGRLDEDKRQAALAALGNVPPAPMALSVEAPRKSSAKAETDQVILQLKQLQYGREAGELVSADEVDQAARQALASMREAFGNRKREIAETICLQFGLTAEKASPLQRLLSREFEATLGVFGEAMATLAAPGAPQAEPAALATA